MTGSTADIWTGLNLAAETDREMRSNSLQSPGVDTDTEQVIIVFSPGME